MATRADPEGEGRIDDTRIPGTGALTRGLALLNLIAEAPAPLRFAELQTYSGLPKGTLHRMLQALIDQRLIKLDPSRQTYILGNRVFEMAHKVWSAFDLRGAAEPELERLRALAGETARLGVLDGDDVLIIDQREAVGPMRMGNGVGSRMGAASNAIGKALLAYRSPEGLAGSLARLKLVTLTPNTITDRGELGRELDLGRARGYAISIEEQHVGVSSVAAPILDHRGRALGAISITGPAFRLTPDRLHALGREVIESARRVSGTVGESYMTISETLAPNRAVDAAVRCAVPASAFLGEAPHWMPGSDELLWVDILAPSVHVTRIASAETRATAIGELVGTVVPRRRGGYLAATSVGFRALNLDSGAMTTLAQPPAMAGRRFNDGKCDAAGRLWAGTLALDATQGGGTLYRLDVDGTLAEIEAGFHICNGMGWNADATRFYFADSGRRTIYVYDFELALGTLANKRVFASFDEGEGIPDGLAIDVEGGVWCAMWDGWSLRRYTPDGALDRVVGLPVPRPTSCCFGGDGLTTLFITSARIRLSASQLAAAPFSGSILAFEPGVAGVPLASFAG